MGGGPRSHSATAGGSPSSHRPHVEITRPSVIRGTSAASTVTPSARTGCGRATSGTTTSTPEFTVYLDAGSGRRDQPPRRPRKVFSPRRSRKGGSSAPIRWSGRWPSSDGGDPELGQVPVAYVVLPVDGPGDRRVVEESDRADQAGARAPRAATSVRWPSASRGGCLPAPPGENAPLANPGRPGRAPSACRRSTPVMTAIESWQLNPHVRRGTRKGSITFSAVENRWKAEPASCRRTALSSFAHRCRGGPDCRERRSSCCTSRRPFSSSALHARLQRAAGPARRRPQHVRAVASPWSPCPTWPDASSASSSASRARPRRRVTWSICCTCSAPVLPALLPPRPPGVLRCSRSSWCFSGGRPGTGIVLLVSSLLSLDALRVHQHWNVAPAWMRGFWASPHGTSSIWLPAW